MLVSSCIFFISTHTHSFYHSSSIQSSPAQSVVCKKSILLDLLIAKKKKKTQRQGRIKKVWLPIVGMQLLTSLFCGKLFFSLMMMNPGFLYCMAQIYLLCTAMYTKSVLLFTMIVHELEHTHHAQYHQRIA